jgi:hypothetical protein
MLGIVEKASCSVVIVIYTSATVRKVSSTRGPLLELSIILSARG